MPNNPFYLGEGCELWYGTYKSIRPTQEGTMINIDLAATAFYKTQDVLDFAKEILQKNDIPRSLNDAERVRFSKRIEGKLLKRVTLIWVNESETA